MDQPSASRPAAASTGAFMKPFRRWRWIDQALAIGAVLGVLVLGLLYPKVHPTAQLHFRMGADSIRAIAVRDLARLGLSLPPEALQLELADLSDLRAGLPDGAADSLMSSLPLVLWRVGRRADWHNPTDTVTHISLSSNNEEMRRTQGVNLSYGLDGRVESWDVRDLTDQAAVAPTDSAAAEQIALAFLAQRTRFDRARFRLDSIRVTAGGTRLVWSDPSPRFALESHRVTVRGDRVIGYAHDLQALPKAADGWSRFNLGSIGGVIVAIGTVLLVLLVLWQLIARARADALDFQPAMVLAVPVVAGQLIIMLASGAMNVPSLGLKLVIVLSSGIFIGMAALLLVATGESLARTAWAEQLGPFDALWRGRWLTPRFGRASLRGLALALIALSLGTLALALVPGVTVYGNELNLMVAASRVPALTQLGLTVWAAGLWPFIALIVLSVARLWRWPRPLLYLVGAICLGFSAFGIGLQPFALGVVPHLLVGLIVTAVFLRTNFVVLIMGAIFNTLIGGALTLRFDGASPVMFDSWLLFCLVAGLIALALIAVARPEATVGDPEYVPEYVDRLAQRERMTRELEIARAVQQQFLPRKTPLVDGLAVATVCVPAYEVGGDYFDFIRFDDRRLGVVIGDVSGKGISAAFYMTLIKGLFRAEARPDASPRDTLTAINGHFYENAERGRFISMTYGIFDLEARTLTFARAGHNPVIVHSAASTDPDGVRLCPTGMAMGLTGGARFRDTLEECTVGLTTGDVFLFYTDGFSEAMDGQQNEFGEERLTRLAAQPGADATAVLSTLRTAVQTFVGTTPQHDDMTMVVVKVTG